nr:CAunnamed protein product [Biomphalaria glabrata]
MYQMEDKLESKNNHISNQESTKKPESSLLTECQISEILKVLEDTRHVLDKYIVIFEEDPVVEVNSRIVSSWWGRHCWPEKRRKLYRYIAIVTAGLQFAALIVISVVDSWPKENISETEIYIASISVMSTFQFFSFVLVAMTTGHVIKQQCKQTLHLWTLTQLFIATTLFFTGIYCTSSLVQESSWRVPDGDHVGGTCGDSCVDRHQVFVLYSVFLLLSISTATLAGYPYVATNTWFNSVLISLQMLLSFYYFTTLVGLAIAPKLTQLTKSLQSNSTKPQRRYSTFSNTCRNSSQTTDTVTIRPPQRRRSTPEMDNVMRHLGLQLQQQYFNTSQSEDIASHC